MLLYLRRIALSLLHRRIFAWLGCFMMIWAIVVVALWQALINQPSFTFYFQLNVVFPSYFIVFQPFHLPCE
jgi:hypothetical protein